MRVLFVNVSKEYGTRVYREYPLGVGILATIVRNAGHTVKIYDMAVEKTHIIDVISDFEPDVIGLSYTSMSAYTAYKLLKILKNTVSAVLIAGGIHPTLYYEDALNQGFDYVVIGEGEHVILPLIDNVGNNNSDAFDQLRGIAYKDGNNIIYRPQTAVVNLNELPFIDRNLFAMNYYPYHSIISSRGCIHKCMFCSSKGLAGCIPRMSSPEKIISEMEFLAKEYGKINLYWADDMFFHDHAARIHFCDLLIKKRIPIQYIIQLRADNINDELIVALKQSGCVKIAIGAESGSNEILKTIKKGINKEAIKNAIDCAKINNLRIKTWWIVGLPGTYDQQLEALEIIKLARPNEVAIHTFVPLPGSEFWNNADKYGIHVPTSLQQLELLGYYNNPDGIHFDYLSAGSLHTLINTYEQELLDYGYVPTDKSNGTEDYIYTSPNQKQTFEV
jgi:radical SAM superfamily enzyme YgiQ (UPF0313 family)